MLPLILLVLLQGVPVAASQSGSISGVLTNSTGKPAAGVRVSALARPDSPLDALTMSAMASIAETDPNGAFKLENIPPGRYYIVAGRIDQPTYYPGTLEMTGGKDLLITPGIALTGMNFVLKDNSAGRNDPFSGVSIALEWTIPIRVVMEGGGKLPISDKGLFPVLRLTRVADNQIQESPLTATSFSVALVTNPEYRVTIENLSTRYNVKSIISDKTDLLANTLKLPSAPAPVSVTANPGNTVLPPRGQVSQITITSFSNLTAVTLLRSTLPPVPTIEVVLAEVAGAAGRTGATITGSIAPPLTRSIEVSGIAGSIYEDGTFDVRNVPAGRHTVFTRNNPSGARPVGASIIVGDQDIHNIPLQTILETPQDFDSNIAATLRGTFSPGTVVPPATVRGHIVSETTGARFDTDRAIGRITVNGNTVSYTINNTGDFEIQNLLPGRYELELWVFGGSSYKRTLDVRDDDITIQWPVSVP